MPPKRSQRLKRPASSAAVQPPTPRRRRVTTPPQVSCEQNDHIVQALPDTAAIQPSSPDNPFPHALVQTLVSTVTAEVTRQLSAILPSLPSAAPSPTISTISHGNTQSQLPATSGGLATMLVNGAVASAHASISGEPQLFPTVNCVAPTQAFHSASLSIDARVSDKLKAKIWNEEFVEFGSLLSNPAIDDKYHISLQHSDDGKPASFCLEPASKPKKVLTVDTWLRAFHVFVGVYTQKHPSEAPALMKYGETIQDLAARGQNWRFYDENFRFLRQTMTSLVPWGSIHWELWLRSQYPQNNKFPAPRFNNASPRQEVPVPRGYCFKFQKGTFCQGCAFKHTCFKCEGAHRADQCNFRGPAAKPFPRSDRPSAAKSSSADTNKN